MNLKYISILWVFLLVGKLITYGQFMETAKGIRYDKILQDQVDWKAHWIWTSDNENANVIMARRTIDLQQGVDKAVLHITASQNYKLYINDKYVSRGPARSAPHHQSFDSWDVAALLQQGKNVIAVKANYQPGKKSYQHEGRAGLLAQLEYEINGENKILISDDKWRVSRDKAWDNNAPAISRFQLFVNDRVDLRKNIHQWQTLSFNDKEWNNATALMRTVGWPAPQKNAQPQTLTPPWTSLVPREISYLIEKKVKANKLIKAVKYNYSENKKVMLSLALDGTVDKNVLNDFSAYLKKEKSFTVEPQQKEEVSVLVFDLDELKNGFPYFDIQGEEGVIVEVMCAPFQVDNKFSYKRVDSEFKDRIVLSGKQDKWEALNFKPTRYMALSIKGNTKAVRIHELGIHQIKYPYKKEGTLSSQSASWIKDYFIATAKTIDVCTTDAITDNYRERRQYAQTGYYGAVGNYYTFGDFELQRRYLVQVAQEQIANGLMPAYAPLGSNDFMVILDSNCLYIRSLYNYLLYSGDYETVKELLPAAKKMLALLHSYTIEGMLYEPPYAYWLDHTLNDRRGANLNLNGHYLGALRDFAKIMEWMGDIQTKVYAQRAEQLTTSLKKYFWNEEKQLFVDAWIDGKQSKVVSEHANAMALAMGIASKEQAEVVASQLLKKDKHNYIFRESGVIMVTPAMSYFLHKGLCEYGYVKESFEMFRRRFDKMLAENTNQTLWEEWWLDGIGRSGKFQKGRTRSDAQTESAFAPALFAEYILGFTPVKPGLQEINLSYVDAGIEDVEAIVPTPQGNLEIKWNIRKGKKGELKIEVPGNIVVNLDLKSLPKTKGVNNILLNGNSLKENDFIQLTQGCYNVSF